MILIPDVIGKDEKKTEGQEHIYLFTNPKGKTEKVSHYNWGVRVSSSIGSIVELSKKTWESGRLGGEVNEDILKLNQERTSIARQRCPQNLEKLIDELLVREPYINMNVQKYKLQQEKHELDLVMGKLLQAFDAVYEDIEQSLTWVKGKEGTDEKRKVSKTEGKGTTIMDGEGQGSKKSGRPLFKDDPLSGKEIPVRRAKRSASLYNFSIQPFDLQEKELRSILDRDLHTIKINEEHPEYIDAKETSDKARDRYLAFLIAKERAQEIFERRVNENTAIGSDYRLLTEIIVEGYNRAIKLMDLQE